MSVLSGLRTAGYRIREQFTGNNGRYWTFSAVEFTYWFATGAAGYLTVFLQGQGMSSSRVGIINAINSAVAIVAAPFWGTISDKMHSLRKTLILCLVVGSLMWMLVPTFTKITVGPVMLAMLFIPAGSFFRNPASSLKDSWVVMNANVHRLNYGGMRLWGSISYAIMSIGLGFILDKIGVESTFYIYAAAMVPLMVLVFLVKDDGQKKKSIPLREMHFGAMFKSFYFVTFLIFAVALNMPANLALSFLPYLIAEIHGNTAQLGWIMGYKALLEIPVLLIMTRLRKRFPIPVILCMAAVFYVCEAYLYSVANSMASLILISTFHGLGGGILIGVATNYVYILAPDNLKATAQTLYASVNSMAGILGNLLGGYLIDTAGVRNFYMTAGTVILAAFLFFMASILFGTRVLKKPMPGRDTAV